MERRRLAHRFDPPSSASGPEPRQAIRQRRWPPTATAPAIPRYFWGLRMHLMFTLAGLPISPPSAIPRPTRVKSHATWSIPSSASSPAALAKATSPTTATRPRVRGLPRRPRRRVLRPAFRNERPRPGARLLKPLRHIIESSRHAQRQLDLERPHHLRPLTPGTSRLGLGRRRARGAAPLLGELHGPHGQALQTDPAVAG